MKALFGDPVYVLLAIGWFEYHVITYDDTWYSGGHACKRGLSDSLTCRRKEQFGIVIYQNVVPEFSQQHLSECATCIYLKNTFEEYFIA